MNELSVDVGLTVWVWVYLVSREFDNTGIQIYLTMLYNEHSFDAWLGSINS